jgi:hypothetical protein
VQPAGDYIAELIVDYEAAKRELLGLGDSGR